MLHKRLYLIKSHEIPKITKLCFLRMPHPVCHYRSSYVCVSMNAFQTCQHQLCILNITCIYLSILFVTLLIASIYEYFKKLAFYFHFVHLSVHAQASSFVYQTNIVSTIPLHYISYISISINVILYPASQ